MSSIPLHNFPTEHLKINWTSVLLSSKYFATMVSWRSDFSSQLNDFISWWQHQSNPIMSSGMKMTFPIIWPVDHLFRIVRFLKLSLNMFAWSRTLKSNSWNYSIQMLAYPRNLKAVRKTNRKNKRPLFSLSNLRYHFFLFWNCNVYWWCFSLIIDLFSDH